MPVPAPTGIYHELRCPPPFPSGPMTTTLPAPVQNWRYRIFASTWLCYIGFYFCRKPFTIAKHDIGVALDLDASTLGYIGAAYSIAYMIGHFLAGGLGTRFGARVVLLTGMCASILLNVLMGISTTGTLLIGLMTLNGLAQATGWSNNVGTMAAWFHRQERGRVMGVWSTNFTLGSLLATWASGAAIGVWGFRSAFFMGAIVLTGVLTFFFFNHRNRPEDLGFSRIDEPQNELSLPIEPDGPIFTKDALINVLLIGVFYFFLKFIRYAIWSWAPFLLSGSFELSTEQAANYSTLFEIFGIAGTITVGFLSDKVFKGQRAFISLLMTIGLAAACAFFFAFGTHSLGLFSICLALVGFFLFGPDALMTGAGAIDVSTRRGATAASGIISGLGASGQVVQDLVIGKLYDSKSGDIGPIVAWLFGSAACAAVILLVLVIRARMGKARI